MKMRVIEIAAPGGPDMLRLAERPVPAPGEGEVLIRVDAAGVNRPDILQRLGLYPPPEGASDLPGLEAAGVVEALGPGVEGLHEGQPVCALLSGGGNAEFAVAPAGSCLPVPQGLSPEEAAALPETAFTVWANVFDDAGLVADETLLVHGGTSGVGAMAIAMAKAFGARVIATASSDEKCAWILKRGADVALRYDAPDWEATARAQGGADVVLDMAGGDFVHRNLSVLKPGGRHVSIAFLRGSKAEIDIMTVMRKRLRLSGSTMKARSPAEKARLAAALKENVWPLIAAGRIRPSIHAVFPLADAANAHRLMESGAHFGKIVLSTH